MQSKLGANSLRQYLENRGIKTFSLSTIANYLSSVCSVLHKSQALLLLLLRRQNEFITKLLMTESVSAFEFKFKSLHNHDGKFISRLMLQSERDWEQDEIRFDKN
jgi:hypothetical protein